MSLASTKLINEIIRKGCDCIVFVKDNGRHSVVPFFAESIIPISQNGVPIENDEITTDSKEPVFLMSENTNEKFVEKARENEFDIDYDSGYNEIEKVKCRNERLEDEGHTVTNVPFIKKQIEIDGKIVEVVVPEFDSFFDAWLPEELYTVSDRRQFKDCYSQLRKELKKNSELRKCFSTEELEQIENSMELKRYTWHHDAEKGRMQLVNKKIHEKTGHTGGRFFWGGGTKKR